MSNYTKTTNFTAKDALPSGDSGKIIKGSDVDTEFDNIATSIATKAELNGSATELFSVAAATGANHAPRFEQVQGGTSEYATAGGTDTYSATLSPAITAYNSGFKCQLKFTNANTATAPTINLNTVGAKTIKKKDSSALAAGDIQAGGVYDMIYDGTDFLLLGRVISDFTMANDVLPPLGAYLPKAIFGLGIDQGTDSVHDIDIGTGGFCDAGENGLFALTSVLTKQIDASWVEGTASGGFPTGISLSANTWYHLFVIAKTDGTVDGGFDTSLTATNLLADATGYSYYRRIGSIYTNGSSQITSFNRVGDWFFWPTANLDWSSSTWVSTPTLTTVKVPTGVNILARVHLGTAGPTGTGTATALIASPSEDYTEVNTTGKYDMASNTGGSSFGMQSAAAKDVITNTSGQIYVDATVSTPSKTAYLYTYGWRDYRGTE